MPEIKQNFIRGKMNKDLDERLIQKGEYREAQNVHIVESTDSDTGALENTRGNVKMNGTIAPDSGDPTQASILNSTGNEVIGYCKDSNKNRIIYFVTDIASTIFADNIRANTYYDPNSADADEANQNRCAIVLYDIQTKTSSTLVVGSWLNFSKNHLITGAAIIDDLLFWTDDYNQPRKINIQTALDNYFDDNDQYYNHEEQVSVAKYAPYKSIILNEVSTVPGYGTSTAERDVTNISSEYMKDRFIRFSYRYRYDDGEYSLFAPFTQVVFEPLNKAVITNSKTDDEVNSTGSGATLEPAVPTGKKEVYKKTTVDIMQNKINKVTLRIPIPNKDEFVTSPPSDYFLSYSNPFNITEIDIVLKESDGLSFKLVKTIKIEELVTPNLDVYEIQPATSGNTYYRQCFEYTYNSSEPFKTLPESEVTRVFDQVPLKAKALDIVGSRLVYGNYVENYPFPVDASGNRGINYTVGSDIKGVKDQQGTIGSEPYSTGLTQWMHNVYKYHTLKQRRTYQVGIVFSDIFGRQSPVITSSSNLVDADTVTISPVVQDYSGNTSHEPGSWDSSRAAFGLSLNISFQDSQLTNDPKFKAVLDQFSSDYNPHGWYSYRIVVKQTEQDYYNVYCSHPFDNWDNVEDTKSDTLTGGRSWLSLHGDNINKVPRSINENNVNRNGASGSDVKLYPKVVFDDLGSRGESAMNNEFHQPTEVISLGTALEQNLYISSDDSTSGSSGFDVYNFVYGKDKNPIVAELVNMKKYYASGSSGNNNIYEFFAGADVTDSLTVVFNSDIAGTAVGGSDDDYNDYLLNNPNLQLKNDKKTVSVVDYTASSSTATLSSEQSFTQKERILLSNYLEGLSVFETEPFKSNIDIYYETSTSGLVSDLMEEINILDTDLPRNIEIKQVDGSNNLLVSSPPFTASGGAQPPVLSSDSDYGEKVFVYENTGGSSGSNVLGILSADRGTTATATPFTIDFQLISAINLGTGLDDASFFEIVENSGNYELRSQGENFVFQNNSKDNYKITVGATDSQYGTSYKEFDLIIKNTVPSISGPSSVSLSASAGSNSTVIFSQSNAVSNGSVKISGDPNNQSLLTSSFSFPATTLDSAKYFSLELANYTYRLSTTNLWTESEADKFFAQSEANRTITIKVFDQLNVEANFDCIINEAVMVQGLLWYIPNSNAGGYSFDAQQDICDTLKDSSPVNVFAVQDAGGIAPYVQPNGYLRLLSGNKIYSDSSLISFQEGYWFTQYTQNNRNDEYEVYVINSSNTITSIIVYRVLCQR